MQINFFTSANVSRTLQGAVYTNLDAWQRRTGKWRNWTDCALKLACHLCHDFEETTIFALV